VTTTSDAGKPAERLPAARTPPWRYAIGMLGTSIPINLIKGSMLYFYVDLLGMNAKVYAAVYTVYGIIDAIDNPVFGYLSDRTRTRWGRRRPYRPGVGLPARWRQQPPDLRGRRTACFREL
jgi:GPH family glycoside/pentoside/hexuronide:cation symporter